jgi:thiosulfate reductase cytochrome b subunit
LTEVTAVVPQGGSKIIIRPATVRVTHWLNALAILVMIMSGWRIYNSEPIFPFRFPVELTLGGSYDGSVDIHNEDGLAGALQWHFAGMWLLAINGLVYVSYGIVCGCRTGSELITRCRGRSISACSPPGSLWCFRGLRSGSPANCRSLPGCSGASRLLA